jgi:hypothetical protein
VRIITDNLTAMLYINKLGGRVQSLRDVTKRIWNFAQSRQLHLSAEYINTLDNKLADHQSRVFSNPNIELSLRAPIFVSLQQALGPLDIDCFAAMENHQLPKYMALHPDPFSIQTDFFSKTSPRRKRLYCFPPFNLVLRLLGKLEREGSTAVVILPLWPSRPFWPIMLTMLAQCPLTLPHEPLTHPRGLFRKGETPQFPMIACLLSGENGVREHFQMLRGNSGSTTSTRTLLKETLYKFASINDTFSCTANSTLLELVMLPNSLLQVWSTRQAGRENKAT